MKNIQPDGSKVLIRLSHKSDRVQHNVGVVFYGFQKDNCVQITNALIQGHCVDVLRIGQISRQHCRLNSMNRS